MNDEFDFVESLALKDRGMAVAAMGSSERLALARGVAKRIALKNPQRECHADQVGRELQKLGVEPGPWCGSIFKGADWVFTGHRTLSARRTNHAREIKIWRLA